MAIGSASIRGLPSTGSGARSSCRIGPASTLGATIRPAPAAHPRRRARATPRPLSRSNCAIASAGRIGDRRWSMIAAAARSARPARRSRLGVSGWWTADRTRAGPSAAARRSRATTRRSPATSGSACAGKNCASCSRTVAPSVGRMSVSRSQWCNCCRVAGSARSRSAPSGPGFTATRFCWS